MSETTAKDIIKQGAPRGEEDRLRAVRRIYDQHWHDLCRYVAGTFGEGPPEPEDVAQAAFTKFAALKAPQAMESPYGFLRTTARNIVISHKRHDKVRRAYLKEAGEGIFAEGGDDFTAERVLLGKERLDVVTAALQRMPRRRRRMLLLHRVHGLSQAEVARRMGLSASAVKKQITRALNELHAALQAQEEDR